MEETNLFLKNLGRDLEQYGVYLYKRETHERRVYFKNPEMDEANRGLEIAGQYFVNGKYGKALKTGYKVRLMIPKMPGIENLVSFLENGHDITHYELLGVEETASEKEIRSAIHKLLADLNLDMEKFLKAPEPFRRIYDAMGVLLNDRSKYDNDLAVAREARARARAAEWRAAEWRAARAAEWRTVDLRAGRFAEWRAAIRTFFSAETQSNLHTVGLGMASMNTETLLEANKDEAIRAQEIAITKANQGGYHDALKFARKAQQMNPELPKIKKLVASLEILSASSDTTYYNLLGVEETANAKQIGSAYRRLSIDVHPDQNTFPKASEAFKRIAIAARVLSDEKSRAKYDHDLAAACESAQEAVRNAAAHEAAVREASAREAAPPEAAARESAAREAAASFVNYDAFSGESFSTDTSSTDTFYTDTSSTDDSSTNASSTDDVGPGSKRASDAQSTSTLQTPKKRREGHGPL